MTAMQVATLLFILALGVGIYAAAFLFVYLMEGR